MGNGPLSDTLEYMETDHILTDAAARIFIDLHPSRKQIRLLNVNPVICTISHTSLLEDSPLPYETISYCWGNHLNRDIIEVDGAELNVPASCAQALRKLRRPDTSRTLWIDAACINQSNIEEKRRQVSFMGEVYRKASRNLIWLGDEDSNSEHALEAIQLILQDARIETKNFKTLAQTAYDENGAYVISSTALNVTFEPGPLLQFFERPWFHRLWVVQEAALARRSTCHCGKLQIALTDILRAAQWLFYKQRFLSFPIFSSRGIVNAARVWEFADHQYGWLHSTDNKAAEFRPLLHALRDFDSHDPRDHVFGVLGLYQALAGTKRLPQALFPDYNRSPLEVFESSTRFAIEERADLDVLSSLLHWEEEIDTGSALPSWVPRWHRPVENDKDALRLAFFFRADRGMALDLSNISNPRDPKSLSLRGIIIDTISNITQRITADKINDLQGLYKLITEIKLGLREQSDPSVDSEGDFDLVATLVAGRTVNAFLSHNTTFQSI